MDIGRSDSMLRGTASTRFIAWLDTNGSDSTCRRLDSMELVVAIIFAHHRSHVQQITFVATTVTDSSIAERFNATANTNQRPLIGYNYRIDSSRSWTVSVERPRTERRRTYASVFGTVRPSHSIGHYCPDYNRWHSTAIVSVGRSTAKSVNADGHSIAESQLSVKQKFHLFSNKKIKQLCLRRFRTSYLLFVHKTLIQNETN